MSESMYRRDVIRLIGAAVALPFLPRSAEAAVVLGERIHREGLELPFRTLNAEQQALVTDVAELIIPETDTPGATSVKVPQFIDLIATDWMHDDERSKFLDGLEAIDERAGGKFVDLAKTRRVELLTALDAARNDKSGAALAFARLKQLTLIGYFTSSIAIAATSRSRPRAERLPDYAITHDMQMRRITASIRGAWGLPCSWAHRTRSTSDKCRDSVFSR